MKANEAKYTQTERLLRCEVCNKPMQAPYGSWRGGDGSCSKRCEQLLAERKANEINARFTSPSG